MADETEFYLRISQSQRVLAILAGRIGDNRLELLAGEGSADEFKISASAEGMIDLGPSDRPYEIAPIGLIAAEKYRTLLSDKSVMVGIDFTTAVRPGE